MTYNKIGVTLILSLFILLCHSCGIELVCSTCKYAGDDILVTKSMSYVNISIIVTYKINDKMILDMGKNCGEGQFYLVMYWFGLVVDFSGYGGDLHRSMVDGGNDRICLPILGILNLKAV